LRPYLAPEYQHLTIEEFRDNLAREILGVSDLAEAKTYSLDAAAKAGVDDLNQRYFKNWDWIYGQSPAFELQHRRHFTAGTVDFRLNIANGRIADLTVYGDFFGSQPVQVVLDQLKGVKYTRTAVTAALADLDLQQYFGQIDRDQLIELIVEQGETGK